MNNRLGITQEGLKVALDVKERYRERVPLCVPGEEDRILIPEYLLNKDIDLTAFEDPLPLALVATRDPEPPMALAAATRLTKKAQKTRLVESVYQMVGEDSRHPLVRRCVELIRDNAFDPEAVSLIERRASNLVVQTRQQYTLALRNNLRGLLDGDIAPRDFVRDFFKLTEAGNLRQDIRKKLVVSLLLSETVRPSAKFLMLENFERFPRPVQLAIISSVVQAEPSHHVELIKEELRWLIQQRQSVSREH